MGEWETSDFSGIMALFIGTLSSDDEADDDDGLYRVETGTEKLVHGKEKAVK